MSVSALALLAVVLAGVPAAPGLAAQAAPTAPEAWKYVPYQIDQQQEAALGAALAALASSDDELQRATEALDLAKTRQPAAYRLLIRASAMPNGDPAGQASAWWRLLMAPNGGIPMLSLVYHEYTHVAQGLGTPAGLSADNVFVNQPVILHLYPMEDYWVGVPVQRGLMPVVEVFGDVPDPQPFDRTYLESLTASGNSLFSVLGEVQAYTRQAELEMALYDSYDAQPGSRDTRYSLLRQLYHLDLYLAHLHDQYPEQWASLIASRAVPYLVKGLTDRAWSVAHELKGFPKLTYNSELTESTTLAHTGSVQAFVGAAGVSGPVALDPRVEALDSYGIYVFGF